MVTKQGNGGTPPTYSKTKLVIAEDEALLAEALSDLLHTAPSGGIEVVQICLDRSQLFGTMGRTTPDVLLWDVGCPPTAGI